MTFALPSDIETPALVVDLDRLEANVAAMAKAMAERGVALRPHAKTHKSTRIARMQLDAGAVGISAATLGEAEVLADGGVDDIFVAYPVIANGPRARRLRALCERARLTVGVDSVEGAELLAAAAGSAPLGVLVEIDCGQHRSGVRPEAAVDVAACAAHEGLDVVGVFTHGGHAYGPGLRALAAADENHALRRAAEALEARRFRPHVVSAGSSPTAVLSARGRVNEERPGTYVFNDSQQLALGIVAAEQIAAVVASTVVSTAVADQFVLDAGSKAVAADRPPWVDGHGLVPEYPLATISRLSEHHAVATVPGGSGRPSVGDVVAVVPNHICAAVNLVDEYVVVRGGQVVDIWPVDARGRNR